MSARFPSKKFCIIDDQGKHFWVTISNRPPLRAAFQGGTKLGGQQMLNRIWIRDGMGDDKTDFVLRHEIAHPRVPRHRLYDPLRDRMMWGLAVLLFPVGFPFFAETGSMIVSYLAFVGMVVETVRGYGVTIDSKEHEALVDEAAKTVTYRIHDHEGRQRGYGASNKV